MRKIKEIMKPKKINEGAATLSEIQGLSNEEVDGSESHKDQLIKELHDIISFDIAELMDENGKLKPLADQPDHVLKAVDDLKVRLSGTGEYDADGVPIIEIIYGLEFPDKLEALYQLGLLVGAFEK